MISSTLYSYQRRLNISLFMELKALRQQFFNLIDISCGPTLYQSFVQEIKDWFIHVFNTSVCVPYQAVPVTRSKTDTVPVMMQRPYLFSRCLQSADKSLGSVCHYAWGLRKRSKSICGIGSVQENVEVRSKIQQFKDTLGRRWKLCLEYEDLRKQSSQAVIITREYCRPTWEKLRLQGKDIVKLLSRVRLFATTWTVAYEAPPSMGFSRQGWWSGLPFPSPGNLPNPVIELGSPTLQTDTLPSELPRI